MTTVSFSRWASLADAVAHYQVEIDRVAGEARARFAFSTAIDEEYQLTANQAEAYVAAGYAGTPGDTVQSWADATGQTPAWAADNIIATRDLYTSALEGVRRIRLVAKAQMTLATSARDIQAIFLAAEAQLQAIAPPA